MSKKKTLCALAKKLPRKLDKYAEKVRALTGAPKPQVVAEPVKKTPKTPIVMMDARCGAPCKGKRGLRMHQMNCKKCKSMGNSEGG